MIWVQCNRIPLWEQKIHVANKMMGKISIYGNGKTGYAKGKFDPDVMKKSLKLYAKEVTSWAQLGTLGDCG